MALRKSSRLRTFDIFIVMLRSNHMDLELSLKMYDPMK